MADETLKPIEEVQVGDQVKSRNGINKVKEAHIYSIDGNITMYSLNNLKVTHNHPMFVDGKWSTPSELKWNNKEEFIGKLYNLVTDDSFIVEGVIASGTAQDNLNVVVDENGISKVIY